MKTEKILGVSGKAKVETYPSRGWQELATDGRPYKGKVIVI